MLGPHDFRHQERKGDREHAVTECLQTVGVRQAYLWPRRTLLGLGGSLSFLLGGVHRAYKQAKSVYHHDRRQLRQAWAVVPGLSPHACAGNGGSSLFPEGKKNGGHSGDFAAP